MFNGKQLKNIESKLDWLIAYEEKRNIMWQDFIEMFKEEEEKKQEWINKEELLESIKILQQPTFTKVEIMNLINNFE